MPGEDWDKFRNSNLKFISVMFIVSAILMIAISCDFFGILQNPADPNSPNYQGYPVVDKLSLVVPMAPKSSLNYPPTLYSAKLIGASAYRFQISIEESFASPEYDKEQSGNIFSPIEWIPSLGDGPYRFRVQAKKDSTWGPWSISEVFSINSEGTILSPHFSATSGIFASAQQVFITVPTQGALIRYTTDGTNPSTTKGVLYSAPVQVSTSLVLKAIAYKPGWHTSEISSAAYTINGALSSPNIIPDGGTFTSQQSVIIVTATQGASIRYTIDGSTPTSSHGLPYSGAFTISSSCTLRAVAYKQDWLDSGIASSVFTITGTLSTPSFSPATGTYTSPQQITLSSTPSDATIRYTTDGSIPSETFGTIYSGPFQISTSATIKAIAYKIGWVTSQVASGSYAITGTVATPLFSPGGGTYTTAQEVSISCALSGATIRYTIDGSTPSKINGTIYSSPVPINDTTNLKAIAYKKDWLDSDIFASSYTIISGSETYFTDFSTNPNWETNNPTRYFWDQSLSVYSTTNYTNSGDWATKTIYYSGGSFTFSADIKPTDRDTGDVCFGLFDDNRNSNSSNGEKAYVLVGGYSPVVYLYSISKTGNNCVSAEAVMIPNEWHNITVKYDNEFQKIDILVKRNGSNVLSWNGDIANGFSTNLRHLGISMNGSWSQSGRYEKAIIDNVSYSQVISNVTSNPMFSPSEGTYNGPQQITLSSTPSDATIRYTIDGSNPTETVGTIYSGPFQVSTNTTIKAVAYKTGWITSQVISGSYTITTPQTFQIGDIGPAGGLIFYKSNNVYYEAAPYDQSSGITWWNGTSILAGTVGAYGIDFGKSNTQKIVNTQGDGNYAASICDDLLLNGYSDWYLPSEDALEYMYRNLKLTGLGDFSSGWYWSSTELDATYARYLRFDNGFRDGAYGKYGEYYVRAMREFK